MPLWGLPGDPKQQVAQEGFNFPGAEEDEQVLFGAETKATKPGPDPAITRNQIVGAVNTVGQNSGNVYLQALGIVLPWLLGGAGGGAGGESQREALTGLTAGQAKTQELLQSNLQSQLQGEVTPATTAILGRLQEAQAGQRRALATSQSRAGTSGTTLARAQATQQDQQFNYVMTQLLGQQFAQAQQLAAGQAGVAQRGQLALAAQEQKEFAAFNSALGRIFAAFQSRNDPTFTQQVDRLIQALGGRQPLVSPTDVSVPQTQRPNPIHTAI